MKATFSYSESSELVYCRNCGAIAGEPTECPVYSDGHRFTKTKEPVVCRNCGAVPGRPTECPVYSDGHRFAPVR